MININKLLLTSLFVVCSFVSEAQVTVKVASVKDSIVELAISVEKGWWLHGESKGMEAPYVAAGERRIPVTIEAVPETYRDQALDISAAVFKGDFRVRFEAPNGKYTLHGFVSDGKEFLGIEESFVVGSINRVSASRVQFAQVNPSLLASATSASESNYLQVFLIGFIAGLLALLTPCVFPMVPVTVSFFTNRSKSRRGAIRMGVLYGLCIAGIYLLTSLPFHLFNIKPEALNNIATSAPLNLAFFLIFVFFSLSFFGVLNLTLPASVAGKTDSRSGVGSVAGLFFLSLTTVIVSFSCTGPILGSLLVGSASGGAWRLTAGIGGFGIALGLPFALFAIFPAWLQRVPKSGKWLNTVKISLAFIELALAFKFLSNADMVLHWGLLKREVFIAIWVVIGIAWIVYLLDIKWLMRYQTLKVSRLNAVLACIVFSFAAYISTGLFRGDVKLLSGFAPPSHYSLATHKGVRLEADVINDYDKALALARSQSKPLLVDFTGWACVNCRKMEEQVWTDPQVAKYIKQHFVLVSLYVDDKKQLPIDRRLYDFVGKDSLKKDIVTVGDLHAAMQVETLGQASQPLYAVINNNETLSHPPVGYTPDPQAFLEWLQKNKTQNK